MKCVEEDVSSAKSFVFKDKSRTVGRIMKHDSTNNKLCQALNAKATQHIAHPVNMLAVQNDTAHLV